MLLRYICVDSKCKLYSSHAFYRAKKTKQNKTNKTRMNLSKKSITSSSTKRKTSLLLPLISCIWLWRISENDANNLSNEENLHWTMDVRAQAHTAAEKTLDKNSINFYNCARMSNAVQCVEESALAVGVYLHANCYRTLHQRCFAKELCTECIYEATRLKYANLPRQTERKIHSPLPFVHFLIFLVHLWNSFTRYIEQLFTLQCITLIFPSSSSSMWRICPCRDWKTTVESINLEIQWNLFFGACWFRMQRNNHNNSDESKLGSVDIILGMLKQTRMRADNNFTM